MCRRNIIVTTAYIFYTTSQPEFCRWQNRAHSSSKKMKIISFSLYLRFQMLVISAAGLLNSAIVSMSHEHSGYFGCQYTYAALGYALVPPGTVLLFDLVHSIVEVPWYVYLNTCLHALCASENAKITIFLHSRTCVLIRSGTKKHGKIRVFL